MRSYIVGILFAASATANTTLTFNGTITAGPAFVGEAVSYTFILSDNPAASAYSSGTYYEDESLSDVDLFNNISGSFITGNWVRSADPSSNVDTFQNTFKVLASNDDSVTNMGLSINGSLIRMLKFNVRFSSDPLAATYSDYSQLFIGTSGVYAVANIDTRITTVDLQTYTLNISSLTINAAPIPEPSTYGLILGGLAFAGAAIRRRRTIAK